MEQGFVNALRALQQSIPSGKGDLLSGQAEYRNEKPQGRAGLITVNAVGLQVVQIGDPSNHKAALSFFNHCAKLLHAADGS